MASPVRPSGTGRLVLTPSRPDQAPPVARLSEHLALIGFIGEALAGNAYGAFLVGPDFLRLVTFMGCSPHVELAPPENGGHFCHVRILGPRPAPVLLRGRNAQPPRCRYCRGRIPDWRSALEDWDGDPAGTWVHCPKCGREQRPLDLLWRQSAGFGRLFVTVEDVFPGEAVPVPGLLEGLRQATGVDWHYFYVQD